MKNIMTFVLCGAMLFSSAFMTGCAKDVKATSAPEPMVRVADVSALSSTVYFDFDKADLKDEFIQVLKEKATILKQTGLSVVVEGACDERGSAAYNVTLGLKRAVAVRDFLLQEGVKPEQIATVSLGKYVQVPGTEGKKDEESYRLNRRGEFHIFVK